MDVLLKMTYPLTWYTWGAGIFPLNAATKAKVSMSHLAATKLTEAMVGMEAGGGGN